MTVTVDFSASGINGIGAALHKNFPALSKEGTLESWYLAVGLIGKGSCRILLGEQIVEQVKSMKKEGG